VLYWLFTKTKINFNIKSFSLIPAPAIELRFFNPTSSKLTIDSFVSDVYYNGFRLGLVYSVGAFNIPSNSFTDIKLKIDFDLLSLSNALLDTKSYTENTILFSGTASTLNLPINFTKKITL